MFNIAKVIYFISFKSKIAKDRTTNYTDTPISYTNYFRNSLVVPE